jgi:hypothetical protein
VITFEGELAGDGLEVVEAYCDEEASEGRQVDLELRELVKIDQSGRALLARLVAKGIHLIPRGLYTAHIVQSLQQRAK